METNNQNREKQDMPKLEKIGRSVMAALKRVPAGVWLKLALVLMIAVPMIVLFVAMRRRNMMKVSRDVKRRTAGINAEIESSISGVRVAKAFEDLMR